MYRFFVFVLFWTACLLHADRPNVLILSVDDLRPELGCYGAEHMVTPHIDALAGAAMQFNQAYVQQAVCLPSRVSLFTGMRPNSTGVHDLQTKFRDTIPDAVLMPQHFAAQGYRTFGLGKVLHMEDAREWTDWIDIRNGGGVRNYHDPKNLALIKRLQSEARAKGLKGRALRRYTAGPAYEAADVADNAYHDGAMTERAIEVLERIGDTPFFMVVGFKLPHLPFNAPQKYWDRYPLKSIKRAENDYAPKGAPPIALMTWGELRAYQGMPAKGPVDRQTALNLRRGYYASVSYVDAQVGKIMSALKREGLADNTIVVLLSDHGWKLGEHAMWCKHTNYEIDARVPFLIKAPGKAMVAGQTGALVELLDLYPTLCDLTGTSTPEQCEGTSLLPLMQNPHAQWTELAYSQYPRWGGGMGYSVKSQKGRYTEWIKQASGEVVAREYYDHQKDPEENKNVVYERAYKLEVEQLSAMMRAERNP